MRSPRTYGTDSGFSLIELLTVVSIIGVLSAISIPIVSNLNESSRNSKLESDLGVLNSATKAYIASSGDLSSAKTPADVLQKLKPAHHPARFTTVSGAAFWILESNSYCNQRRKANPETGD